MGFVTLRCIEASWEVEVLVMPVAHMSDWLTVTYPEGGKFGSWPSFYELRYGAFGRFGDLET